MEVRPPRFLRIRQAAVIQDTAMPAQGEESAGYLRTLQSASRSKEAAHGGATVAHYSVMSSSSSAGSDRKEGLGFGRTAWAAPATSRSKELRLDVSRS